jgi:hypothetical protein
VRSKAKVERRLGRDDRWMARSGGSGTIERREVDDDPEVDVVKRGSRKRRRKGRGTTWVKSLGAERQGSSVLGKRVELSRR